MCPHGSSSVYTLSHEQACTLHHISSIAIDGFCSLHALPGSWYSAFYHTYHFLSTCNILVCFAAYMHHLCNTTQHQISLLCPAGASHHHNPVHRTYLSLLQGPQKRKIQACDISVLDCCDHGHRTYVPHGLKDGD